MVNNCNKFHWIVKGVSCSQIISYQKITLAEFIKWNPTVKDDCSGMCAEVNVCVGVIGGGSNPTPTTSAGNGAPLTERLIYKSSEKDAKNGLPAHCVDQYLDDVQVSINEGALQKYKTLIDNGYDKKFEVYEKYVRAQIPEQINNFMATEKVDKYFKCQETKFGTCCNKCRFDGCLQGCIKGSDCKGGQGTYDIACPRMEFEDKGLDPGTYIPNATLILEDSDGFHKDLEDTWGIEQSWITFDQRLMKIENGCQFAGSNVNESTKSQFITQRRSLDSYPKFAGMLNRFKIMQVAGPYDADLPMRDLVDAIALPSFSSVEAVESMEKIVAKADEIKKQEREEMIMNFIMGLLFFIPVAGEAAGAAGLTAARSLLRLIGAAGDIAMTVYDVIQSPDNAFLAVFMHLAGAGVGRGGFRSAAEARRGMTSKEYNSLGNVKGKLDQGIGQHLVGTNHANLAHIRSGQFWETCGQQEADSYERRLEPTLRAGLEYLRENGEETGAIGIRYLRNEDLPARIGDDGRKETCGAGFFTNLEDLENWAKTHKSHLKIYRGALTHYKTFGDTRRFRTWHEVSVIRAGDAHFEYVNCTPSTGVIRSIPLEVQGD
ncbi:Nn.00g070580.m01.CDS01 [Neocucurbitaria sp. VM-36]